jgi:hypothetical protein
MLKNSSLCLYSSNLSTFWLKIEEFWSFEEISIFNNGGHIGYRTALMDTILKGDHPRIRTPTKMATTAELNLTQDPMGNSHKNLLV